MVVVVIIHFRCSADETSVTIGELFVILIDVLTTNVFDKGGKLVVEIVFLVYRYMEKS